MKTWKLVAGILDIILAVFVVFQSSLAGLANTLEANGEVSGSAGVLVAIILLAGGIVSIATRNSTGKGKDIALILMFLIAALMGFSNAGSYSDLNVWSSWCIINAFFAFISLLKKPKKDAS